MEKLLGDISFPFSYNNDFPELCNMMASFLVSSLFTTDCHTSQQKYAKAGQK